MNDLINIATLKHNCKILSVSSCQNQILHPASSIISQGKDNVWISGQGLPQQIIISLQQVDVPYLNITDIAFVCVHDYQTNPKTIQVWVSKDKQSAENGEYVHWYTVEMRRKRGKQMFSITGIPESERVIKILITETYGEYQTYINQIMLLAQPDPQTSQSLFNQQQWNKVADSPDAKIRRINKINKSHHNINKRLLISESHHNQRIFSQHSPLQLLNPDDINMHQQEQLGSHHNYNHDQSLKNLQLDQDQQKSYQKNAAMLAMSKNIVIMEDNIEELTRKVQILEKKVAYTYQNLQANVMKRVEQMIDKKIQKQFSQKQLINQSVPKKLKSCKELATSRTLNNGIKQASEKQRQKQKQKKVLSLVAQLNGKLKQRVKLANKLQRRQKNYGKPRSQYYD